MYHEWECPDCGHELHHDCEITEQSDAPVPQEDSEYCGDPDDPLCGPDFGKPWCAYHGGTDETPPTTRNETNSGTWGNAPKAFTEAPFCQIDPDNRPSPFIRRYDERDIFRIIADRTEKKGLKDV